MKSGTNYERPSTRKEISAALTAAGYKTSEASLAAFACRGGGPPFGTYGRTPLYSLSVALEWARGRSSAPRRAKLGAHTAAHAHVP